jgi:hypothetical protein
MFVTFAGVGCGLISGYLSQWKITVFSISRP